MPKYAWHYSMYENARSKLNMYLIFWNTYDTTYEIMW